MAVLPRIAAGGGRKPRLPPLPPARTLMVAFAAVVALAVLCLFSSSSRTSSSLSSSRRSGADSGDRYLYWGGRVDCPGKHCGSCAGLGHQESSLRCALEEALFLGRYPTLFFCEIDPTTTTRAYRTNERSKIKVQRFCKPSRTPSSKKMYRGAPPPLLLRNLGSAGVPRRTGSRQNSARKSLHLASSPSPSSLSSSPSPPCRSIRSRRSTNFGSGKGRSTALRSCEHPGRGRSVAALRGAPPSERISASTKRRPGRATPSSTPPAGSPLDPRLYTSEIRGSPTLPPPRRPAEGGETSRSPLASWIKRWGKSSLSFTVAGERDGSKVPSGFYVGRIFVMPSRMCLSSVHNTKGTHHSSNATSKQRWEGSSCAMESLYDIDHISRIVPVVLDNSKTWHEIASRAMKLGERGVAHVQGISRAELKENPMYSKALLINRTASPLAWFMECKDRKKRSSLMPSYTFLPSMPAKKLSDAANKMKEILGDYDAIHVRRGDLLKNRKDRSGVERSLHPHLDRDTRPAFIRKRIAKWIPPGRTLYIASNERTPGFFSPLSDRYKLAYSSNFSSILEPIIENNYQLFVVERLMMRGAKTFVKTMKEFDNDLTLCDDPKKNTKVWERPVNTR